MSPVRHDRSMRLVQNLFQTRRFSGFFSRTALQVASVFFLGLSLALSINASHATDAADLPSPYRAEYLAQSSGMSATAFRQLEQIDNARYVISNSLSLEILRATVGKVQERSEFTYTNAGTGIRPHRYDYDQSGVRRQQESVVFNWESALATSSEDGEETVLALSDGMQDKLSFTVQLGLDLAALPAVDLVEGVSFDYAVIDGDDIEQQRYRLTGRETVTTPLGDIETVRVERVREGDSRRRTVFWLAIDRDFLLVRLEQVSSSGTTTELLLQSYADI